MIEYEDNPTLRVDAGTVETVTHSIETGNRNEYDGKSNKVDGPSNHSSEILGFIVFMIMGSAPNWVFATALAQEIPFFEQTDGLCIATYMNAVTNFGLLTLIIYVGWNKYISKIPHSIAVPFILVLCVFGCLLTAFTYANTVHGIPVMLYISCAIGGIVGSLSAVVLSPFLMFYKNDYISAARCGGSAGILLTALVGLAQDPGSTHERLSTQLYFVIFAILLSLSIFAYAYVVIYGIGLRNPTITPFTVIDESATALSKSEENNDSFMHVHSPSSLTKQSSHAATSSDKTLDEEDRGGVGGFTDPSSERMQLESRGGEPWYSSAAMSDSLLRCICSCSSAGGYVDSVPWLRVTIPYMLTVAWVDFNTWGMLSALIPFAMANVSAHGGAENLATAYEIGAVCLVLGDVASMLFHIPFTVSLLLFTVFSFTTYICAAHRQNDNAAAVIIIVFSLGRFFEEYLLTMSYRAMATRLPVQHREAGARAVGIVDQIATTLGAVVSTALVASLVSCNSNGR